jgi:hypothetical protein
MSSNGFEIYRRVSMEVFNNLLAEHGVPVQKQVMDFVRKALLDRGAEEAPYTVAVAARILMITARTFLQNTVKDPGRVFQDWTQEINEYFLQLPESKVQGALSFPAKDN